MFNIKPIDILNPPETATKVITRNDLSQDQAEVYDSVLAWHQDANARQYLKLGGYAGTGKTTLVGALAKELESQGEQVAYVAFTGKAVNVLSKKLRQAGVNGACSTLHSLMYKPNSDNNGKILSWTKHEDLPFSFIVVDEASMVGADLWEDLLSYGLPVLAVGDHGQLPPIGDSIVNLMLKPDLRLEKIHRQAEGNPILAFAQHVREGKPHNRFEPTDNRVSFIRSVSEIGQLVAKDPLNFGAICYTNRTRASLNKFIRAQRGLTDVYPTGGDIVICLKNKKPIFNGMRGIVTDRERFSDKFDSMNVTIEFEDDGISLDSNIYFPQFGLPKTLDDLAPLKTKYAVNHLTWDQLGMLFDYGYAMTCHKAQGSQFASCVLIYENFFRDSDTRNRWLYTAGTRASERLYVVRP